MNNHMLKVQLLWISILLTIASGVIVQANPTHNVSEIIDGVEFKLETDKAVYEYGEVIDMMHSITNHSDQIRNFGVSLQEIFTVHNQANWPPCNDISCDFLGVWSSTDPDPYFTSPSSLAVTLSPGETFSRSDQWNFTYPIWAENGLPGDFVPVGDYVLWGGFYNTDTNFKLDISIIPEPASAALLTMGAIGLLARRHRYHFTIRETQ